MVFSKIVTDIGKLSSANALSLVTAALTILVLPKMINTEGYGYFQFIQLISVYANVLQFGLTEGIYLRYGGTYYKDLNYTKLGFQFWTLQLISGFVAIIFFGGP